MNSGICETGPSVRHDWDVGDKLSQPIEGIEGF